MAKSPTEFHCLASGRRVSMTACIVKRERRDKDQIDNTNDYCIGCTQWPAELERLESMAKKAEAEDLKAEEPVSQESVDMAGECLLSLEEIAKHKAEHFKRESDPFAPLEFEYAPESRIIPDPDIPRITLRRNGETYLNRQAVERFNGATYAILRFSKVAGVIGVQPLAKKAPGAVKLRKQNDTTGGRTMSSERAFKAWGIDITQAITLPAEWSEAHGMWCAKMPKQDNAA